MTNRELHGLDQLRASVTGMVTTPGETQYDEAVAIWNGSIERRPAVVVRCVTASDVVAAIGYARAEGLELSIRGGGHGFSGSALCDGGLTIDLTNMKSVVVDPSTRRATAGGGVTWGELDAATQQHGLAVPGGMISHTGIAGLTLGGGIGWLCTLAGLTCDNLVGAELITADGAIHKVSETDEPELLWALQGGGGNFGVVTAFEYALHPVGPEIDFAMFYWEPSRGRDALRFVRDLIPTLPRSQGCFIASTNAPDAPFVPDVYRDCPGWVFAVVGFGDDVEHVKTIDTIRGAVPSPDFDLVERIRYVELQRMFDHTAPWGSLAYEKAVHLEELTNDVIDVLIEHQPRKAARLSFTPILVVGGSYRDTLESATAFSGGRNVRYVLNVTAVCESRDLFERDREWVRDYWEALVPHASNSGSYINFMSEFDEDRVKTAYGPVKYARLQALKDSYDPENRFHLNANIRPSAG